MARLMAPQPSICVGIAGVPRVALLTFFVSAGVLAPGPYARAQDDDAKTIASEVIRPFDLVLLQNGNSLEGFILTADWEAQTEVSFRSKSGKTTMTLARAEIKRVIPRQTVEQVYATKKRRVDSQKDPRVRAREELRLGRWCANPLFELGGAKPRESAAPQHYLQAIRIDPSLHEAYPYLFDILISAGAPESLTDEAVERELELALLAGTGGYQSAEIDFRLGMIFATRLGRPSEAVPFLERFLAGGSDNQGYLNRARATLSDILFERGEREKALRIYESALSSVGTANAEDTQNATPDPADFEPMFRLARFYMRMSSPANLTRARELLTKCQSLQPDYPEVQRLLAALDYAAGQYKNAVKTLTELQGENPKDPTIAADLALVKTELGVPGQVEQSLLKRVSEATGANKYRLHLVLGVIHEAKGDLPGALTQFRAAASAASDSLDAQLLFMGALLRSGELEEGRALAAKLLREYPDSHRVFAACSRLLAEGALKEEKWDAAIANLERAAALEVADVALMERLGLLYLRRGELDEGSRLLQTVLRQGGERAATKAGLGFYYYSVGDYDHARQLFEEVLRIDRATKTAAGSKSKIRVPADVVSYAQAGIRQIDELRGLQIWRADFSGDAATTVEGWSEQERFGIEISRKDGRVILSGQQKNAPDGVTIAMLERPVEARPLQRIVMRARVVKGRTRIGLRLEGRSTRRSTGSAGLLFYRDYDGQMKYQMKTTRGSWTPGVPTTSTDPSKGRKVFLSGIKWPDDGEFHTIEIRRATARRGRSTYRAGFDLYFDGRGVGYNLSVTGLSTRQYDTGFSTQTDALGQQYTVEVESFEVYRERPKSSRREEF